MFNFDKRKIFTLINKNKSWYNRFIILSVIFFILHLTAHFNKSEYRFPKSIVYILIVLDMVILFMDFYLRYITAPLKHPNLTEKKAKKRYVTSIIGIIDIYSAIVPLFLFLTVSNNLNPKIMSLTYLSRYLVLLKLSRYFKSIRIVAHVFYDRRRELRAVFSIILLMMFLISVLLYYVENPEQPEKISNTFDAFWLALTTLTTIGYGDLYPITTSGRIFCSIFALLGIGIISLPTAIITSGFSEYYSEERKKLKKDDFEICECCGQKIKKAKGKYNE